jgi:hypothetical protein
MTKGCLSDNTTVTQPRERSGWANWSLAASDIESVPSWGPRGPECVTKGELLRFAQRQIVQLMNLAPNWDDSGGLPASPQSAKMALALLVRVVSADNLATPQVSPTGTGGLDIEWLVSGNHLSLSVASDGNIVLWANGSDGSEVFSFDSTEDPVDYEHFDYALKYAEHFVHEISAGVRNRIAI